MSEKENNEKSYAGTKIKAVPKKEPNIGIDTDVNLYHNILNAAEGSALDIAALESFLNVSQSRENIYKLIDSMAQDSSISSILETYAEDATQTNDEGQIVWAESADANVTKYVNFLLDSMNIDKHIYSWVYSLIKYGDIYLRLYRESDYDEDVLFGAKASEKKDLNEDVILKAHSKSDHYVHYIEKIANPGEMFELTKYGKSMGYIQAPVRVTEQSKPNEFYTAALDANRYKMRKSDVIVYQADDFVHATLEDNSSRIPETVQIFMDDQEKGRDITYTVRRGQSILYNAFKIWRQLSLLKNSVLLNRVTKSSIIRIIQVEVGQMGKEEVGPHLRMIKQLLEQKTSLDVDNGMGEYTNAGPVENNIYVATHDGKGAISTAQLGGDVDVKSLADVDMFEDDLYGALRVPKQFFGKTDDAAGFNGGSSLTIISSRYGKAVNRIQSAIIQAITDVINLMLVDKGLTNYINKFTVKMQAPVTQEEIDRRENMSNKVRIVSDIMSQLAEIESETIKLKILKSLISSVVTDSEVIDLLQEEIDNLEQKELEEKTKKKETKDKAEDSIDEFDLGETDLGIEDEGDLEDMSAFQAEPESSETGDYLETPDELGIDMTQNS